MNDDYIPGRRLLPRLWSRGLVGIAAMIMAAVACYGTLALAALLPLLGISLALNNALWSGAIVLFTGLTVLAILPGVRQHRSPAPTLGAAVGAGLITYALYVHYSALTELGGFLVLAMAAFRDVHLRRRERPPAARDSAY